MRPPVWNFFVLRGDGIVHRFHTSQTKSQVMISRIEGFTDMLALHEVDQDYIPIEPFAIGKSSGRGSSSSGRGPGAGWGGASACSPSSSQLGPTISSIHGGALIKKPCQTSSARESPDEAAEGFNSLFNSPEFCW